MNDKVYMSIIDRIKDQDIVFDSSALNGGNENDKICTKEILKIFREHKIMPQLAKRMMNYEIINPSTPPDVENMTFDFLWIHSGSILEKKDISTYRFIQNLIRGNSRGNKTLIDADLVFECIINHVDILISNCRHHFRHNIISIPSGDSLKIYTSTKFYNYIMSL